MNDRNDKGYFSINVPGTEQRPASYFRMGSPESDTPNPHLNETGGAGIVLKSDGDLKITVAASKRTVLGETYDETYDVSDEDRAKITAGTTTLAKDIQKKQLITASLLAREPSTDAMPLWRTSKFDRSKALTYSVSDSGSFSLGSTYAFAAGFKLTNNVNGTFDTSGIDVKVPFFKVELGDKRWETTWVGGKVTYNRESELKGEKIALKVASTLGLDETELVKAINGIFVARFRLFTTVANVAVTAYTGASALVGMIPDWTPSSSTVHVKGFLQTGMPIYATIATINGVFMAGGIIIGVIQILSAKKPPIKGNTGITLEEGGITLKCGNSSIEITTEGVEISAPDIVLRSQGRLSMHGKDLAEVYGHDKTIVGLGITDETTVLGKKVMISSGTQSVTLNATGTTEVSGTKTTVSGTTRVELTTGGTVAVKGTSINLDPGTGGVSGGGLAKTSDLTGLAKTSDLTGLAKTNDLVNLAENLQNLVQRLVPNS